MYLIDTIRDSVRLTRRGQVALGAAVVAMVLGWQFGARSLNAIAAPALAALAISTVMLARAEDPAVSLSTPDPGFPGETRTLTPSIAGQGLATIELSLPPGLGDTRVRRLVTLPATPAIDIELAARGIYDIGPLAVSYRGPLGLVERAVPGAGTTDVVVYPRRYEVDADSILSRLFLDELEAERQEFDRLREYRPEDPLRHVHWKSSAKHDDFLVMEFSPSQRDETISVVATAPKESVDEMARAAATVTDVALDAGYNVELTTPTGHVPPGQGHGHRRSLLRLLARTEGGTPKASANEEADIEVTVGKREIVVRIGSESYRLSTLVDSTSSTATSAVGGDDDESADESTRDSTDEVTV